MNKNFPSSKSSPQRSIKTTLERTKPYPVADYSPQTILNQRDSADYQQQRNVDNIRTENQLVSTTNHQIKRTSQHAAGGVS